MPSLSRPGAVINFDTHITANTTPNGWITFINGHTRSSSDFRLMGKRLTEAGYNVLTLDNRGSGQTTTDRSFTIEDMASDVIALWDHLAIATSNLVGISMGGMIAVALAARQPQQLSKLALVSTAMEKQYLISRGLAWGQTLESVQTKLATYFASSFPARNPLLLQSMAKQVLKAIESGGFNQKSEAQRQAMGAFQGTGLLGKIQCETLIIHGAEDQVIDINGVHAMKRGIKNSRIAIIEGAGHLLLAEASERMLQELKDFFTH